MIKKTGLLAIMVCLLLVLSSPVQAQDKLQIIDDAAQVEFPASLSFGLSARSDVNITDIRLCYTLNRLGFAEVNSEVYIEFVPGTTVDVEWSLDMVKVGGLPPGTSVAYWWLVNDASGDRVETTQTRILFSDNRYQWRNLTEGQVTIYWYDGDESFARELMSASHQALDRLAADTGALLEKPAAIYIYSSTQDLRGAMIYPREWTAGAAFTRFGIIVIGIAPGSLSWGKRAIAHELAHLVIHQITLNPYSDLPTWLDEGLAMYAEGLPSPQYTSRLYQAITDDNLISVRSLSSPFSAYAEEATLSYAQSYSLVEFLIQQYGQDKMLALLSTFRQGSTYDGALEKILGFDTDALNASWQDYVTEQYQTPVKEKTLHPALIALLAALATLLVIALGLAARSLIRRQGQ
ncbi:peptidase MA family metallohydrolase [Chloroflexota bacterium]